MESRRPKQSNQQPDVLRLATKPSPQVNVRNSGRVGRPELTIYPCSLFRMPPGTTNNKTSDNSVRTAALPKRKRKPALQRRDSAPPGRNTTRHRKQTKTLPESQEVYKQLHGSNASLEHLSKFHTIGTVVANQLQTTDVANFGAQTHTKITPLIVEVTNRELKDLRVCNCTESSAYSISISLTWQARSKKPAVSKTSETNTTTNK